MGRPRLTNVPTETEVSDALVTLEEFVEKTGDNIVDRNVSVLTVTINDEEIILRGHICTDDNHFYYIGAHEELDGAIVAFHYSLIKNIAAEIPEEHATGVLGTAGIEAGEDDPRMIAAQYLYQNIDVSQARNLISQLRIEKSEADTRLTISENERRYPIGFSVERMIFPYEDDFNIRDFYDGVLPVVETGKKLSEVLGIHISLHIDEEDPRNTRLAIE
jgi:hypothetical protein